MPISFLLHPKLNEFISVMNRIEHVAIWARDIERLKSFYEKYFDAEASSKYTNERKQFQSYFLTFSSGARLELMQRPDVNETKGNKVTREFPGYAHLAISTGSESAVDELTNKLTGDGYKLLDGPRRTGDGYYESVILDPEGNRIEITV